MLPSDPPHENRSCRRRKTGMVAITIDAHAYHNIVLRYVKVGLDFNSQHFVLGNESSQSLSLEYSLNDHLSCLPQRSWEKDYLN